MASVEKGLADSKLVMSERGMPSCQRGLEREPENCSDVASALAAVITRIVSAGNGEQSERDDWSGRLHGDDPMSPFCVGHAPKSSVHVYLMSIAKHFQCSRECFVLSLVFIGRISKTHPSLSISPLNVHKLLLASVVVAVKFLDDAYATNRDYARIGGVKTKELNSLEAHFLHLIGWKLHVFPWELDQYRSYLSFWGSAQTLDSPLGRRCALPSLLPVSPPSPVPALPHPIGRLHPGGGLPSASCDVVSVAESPEPAGSTEAEQDEEGAAEKRGSWSRHMAGLLRSLKRTEFVRNQDVWTSLCLLALPHALRRLGAAKVALGGPDIPYLVDLV